MIFDMYKAGSLLYFGTGNSILGKKDNRKESKTAMEKNIMADI